MKLFHDFCSKFEIDNQIVYGRHHSTHLRQTYRILKRNHCKEHVCIAGLFHSIYDKDSIYKNKGADYSERNIVTQFLGTGSEQLIYFYSLFHPTRNFAKTEGDDEVTSMENSDGKISISTAELSSLSDIFIADIVEQIIWRVEKKKYSITKTRFLIGRKLNLCVAFVVQAWENCLTDTGVWYISNNTI